MAVGIVGGGSQYAALVALMKTFVVVLYDTKTRSVLRSDHNATFVGLNLKEYRC
jgi:hypothetical protein